jgi:alpha-ribazole phosphatase
MVKVDIETANWWWVRHGPVAGPVEGPAGGRQDSFPGRGDPPPVLDPEAVAALAAGLPLGALWLVSPLRRAAGTARALIEARPELSPGDGPLLTEGDLAEQDFGDWAGLAYDDIWQTPEGRAFWDAPTTSRPPGGESFAEMVRRVSGAVDRWSLKAEGRDFVAVCHAGPIRAAHCHGHGITPEKALELAVDNLSFTRIKLSGA